MLSHSAASDSREWLSDELKGKASLLEKRHMDPIYLGLLGIGPRRREVSRV